MKRFAFKMFLKPGFEDEYERRHAALWPELQRGIKEAGVGNYSIYWDRDTNILFGYQEDECGQQPCYGAVARGVPPELMLKRRAAASKVMPGASKKLASTPLSASVAGVPMTSGASVLSVVAFLSSHSRSAVCRASSTSCVERKMVLPMSWASR